MTGFWDWGTPLTPGLSALVGEGVLRQAQVERGLTLTPALSHQGERGSFDRLRMKGGDRLRMNGGSPSPQPSPIKGEGS